MLRLTFYIWFDDEQLSELKIQNLDFNPGIGGTQFVTILLATELAKLEYHVRIITNRKIIGLIDDLKVVYSNEFADLIQKVSQEPRCINIFTNEIYDKYKNLIGEDSINILWIHHPHQIVFDKTLNAVVSIGQYQYESNLVSQKSKHYLINNIFPELSIAERSVPQVKPYITYLGALRPGKGFHILAKAWPKVRKIFPELELKVIGSSSVYGVAASHPELPTDAKYGEKIKRNLGEEFGKSVTFFGQLGSEKLEIMAGSWIGIVNPSGRTEAYPASPLEFLSLGVPVMMSNRYAMKDLSQHLPTLAVSSSKDIVNAFKRISLNKVDLLAEKIRAEKHMKNIYLHNQVIVDQWILLFAIVTDNSKHANKQSLTITRTYSILQRLKIKVRTMIIIIKNICSKIIRKLKH